MCKDNNYDWYLPSLIPSHVIAPRHIYPITIIGLYCISVIGVEGGVARVLANTHGSSSVVLAATIPVHALTARLGLLGKFGQG